MVVIAFAAAGFADIANARRLAALPRTGKPFATFVGHVNPFANVFDEYSRLITLAPFASAGLLAAAVFLIPRRAGRDRHRLTWIFFPGRGPR